jgi:radical SAM superfamily enzyme YgiQ (UPF0313 family)
MPVRLARMFGRGQGLALAQLAAVTPAAHNVRLVEEFHQDVPWHEGFDLVAVSVNTANVKAAYRVADHFRGRSVPVVAGGIHATVCPDEVAEHVDAVVVGEGDTIWPQVLEDAARGELAPRYRAARPCDLADLPSPRLDLLALEHYAAPRLGLFVSVAATRGCPYCCAFCSAQIVFGRGYRRRPTARVIDDIAAARHAARSLGSCHVWFVDDTLDADVAYAKELFEALVPLRLQWVAMVSMHAAEDEEFLRLAARSGCQGLFVGVESQDPATLADIGKAHNLRRDYARAFDAFRRHGLRVQASMVFGFPGDRPSTFEAAVDLLIKERVDVGYVHPLCPFPGTELYERFKREGRLFDERFWLRDSISPFTLHRLDHMTPEEYEQAFWRALGRLYSRRAIARRLLWPPRARNLVPVLNMNQILRTQVRERRFGMT